jgi:hypothetical protein
MTVRPPGFPRRQAWGDPDLLDLAAEKLPQLITETMNLTGEPTPRAAKSVRGRPIAFDLTPGEAADCKSYWPWQTRPIHPLDPG